MENIYLLFTGDYSSITGGYIYNRKLVEYSKLIGIDIKPIQLFEKQVLYSYEVNEQVESNLANVPEGSILLIDSLALGYNHLFFKNYYTSHIIVPLVHLPLFLNPDFNPDVSVKEMELETLNRSRHIVVTSSLTKDILKKEGIPGKKISVINPAVEGNAKKDYYPPVPEQLLCVSGISQNKNQLLLIKALKRLTQFKWNLHLVGSTYIDLGYSLDILNFISKNKLEDRITVHGELTGKKLNNLYKRADLFMFPSKFETYGMVVAEALSAGIPVFAYESEGVSLNFNDYPIQYFDDEESLYNLLWNVLGNNGIYTLIANDIRNSNIRFLGWDDVSRSFAELFKMLRLKTPTLVKSF